MKTLAIFWLFSFISCLSSSERLAKTRKNLEEELAEGEKTIAELNEITSLADRQYEKIIESRRALQLRVLKAKALLKSF